METYLFFQYSFFFSKRVFWFGSKSLNCCVLLTHQKVDRLTMIVYLCVGLFVHWWTGIFVQQILGKVF